VPRLEFISSTTVPLANVPSPLLRNTLRLLSALTTMSALPSPLMSPTAKSRANAPMSGTLMAGFRTTFAAAQVAFLGAHAVGVPVPPSVEPPSIGLPPPPPPSCAVDDWPAAGPAALELQPEAIAVLVESSRAEVTTVRRRLAVGTQTPILRDFSIIRFASSVKEC